MASSSSHLVSTACIVDFNASKPREYVQEKIAENPDLKNKTPAGMGIRPFLGTEIKSYVAGLSISIRLEHIYKALRLPSTGKILKTTTSTSDTIDPLVQKALYGKESTSKSNSDMTKFHKVIYKILHESIVPKLGGTDHVSHCHKWFLYYAGLGVKVNVGKFIFELLCETINSVKPNVHHCRLLSHMFVQSGLYDVVKLVFPGFVSFLIDPQFVNGTTLRYLKLMKAGAKVVHPNNPILENPKKGLEILTCYL
jgi:hypothetical protein